MKRRNNVKPGAFEIILGEEKSNRQKWLISLALYGKYGLKRGATREEIEELMDYHNQIIDKVTEEYRKSDVIDGETCYTSENLPPIPTSRWANYIEHIERIKKDYPAIQEHPQIDYQI
ncbi:hypothetical protein J4477_02460 [Candidatus Pacearchaeota archaeon]|nr:hypothetical protein [Candidatus Pacearchaeota archaeon]